MRQSHVFDLPNNDRMRAAITARVIAAVAETCSGSCCTVAPEIPDCAAHAVDALWNRPIVSYIPLLAYREVHDCIRLGSCAHVNSGRV